MLARNGRQLRRPFGSDDLTEVADILLDDVLVEEEDAAEGLVLRGGGDVAVDGQVGQEAVDFNGSHLGGMAFAVEEDEALDPVNIGMFSADRVVSHPDSIAQIVE